MATVPPAPRTALLAGATGLVGRELLALLLASDRYDRVHVLLRSASRAPAAHAKLKLHSVDFADLALALPKVDDVYIALGTTIRVAGSELAFRAVDLTAVLATARAARQAGAQRLAVVSALGADARSRVFYNRVKGEMERALRDLRFERLVVARPSLLAGARHALAQPPRRGERLALRALGPVAWMLPASLRPIEPAVVARAMRYALRTEGLSWQVLESGVMQTLGREPT